MSEREAMQADVNHLSEIVVREVGFLKRHKAAELHGLSPRFSKTMARC